MNNKGQALVEFIIIFPVFAFLLMGMMDCGNILYQKYQLENEIDYVSDLYLSDAINDIDYYAKRKSFKVDYEKTGVNVRINLTKKIKIITPGLNNAIGHVYDIKVERVIIDEK